MSVIITISDLVNDFANAFRSIVANYIDAPANASGDQPVEVKLVRSMRPEQLKLRLN